MTQLDVEWLSSLIGQQVIGEFDHNSDVLNATKKLRRKRPEINSELIRQAVSQALLRVKSAEPNHFLLTNEGLQQATRPQVAKYRANFVTKRYGKQIIIDLTCGLGFDSYYFNQAGHQVSGVENDSGLVKIAQANLKPIQVHFSDAQSFNIADETQIVFIDPARRNPSGPKSVLGQIKRLTNPEDWSPSWSFVKSLADNFLVIAKVAPGMVEELIGDWDAYWISADGDLVETMLVSAGTGKRVAVLLTDHDVIEISGGSRSLVKPIGKYLVIPNPALIRASALDYLVNKLDAGLVNEHIAWLTTDSDKAKTFFDPAAQVLNILEVTKFTDKNLANLVNNYQPSALTIMTRGVNIEPEKLRKKLLKKPIKGGPEIVLAIYRDDSGPICLICERFK
jgi:hypothetical protein